MKKTRKKRLEERREKREKADRQRYEIAERLLVMLDVKELMNPEITKSREYLIAKIRPRIDVIISEDSRQETILEDVRLEVASVIDKPDLIFVGGRAVKVALGDMLRGYSAVSNYIIHLFNWASRHRLVVPGGAMARLEEARARIQDFDQRHLEETLGCLGQQITYIMDLHLSFDRQIFWFKMEPNGKYPDRPALRIVIGRRVQVPHYLPLNGLRRKAYRCELPDLDMGLCPLTWTPGELGIGDSTKPIPVFISDHAVNRLHQRVPIGPLFHILHKMLRRSLEAPRILRGDREGEFLVEAGDPGGKVGYFVVAVTPDFAFVKTFLFLTMQGTPEARKLRERARLTNKDIRLFKLDNLYTLGYSDLGEDPDLRAILSDCDCGHLLDLFGLETRLSWLDGHRAHVRKAVGLPFHDLGGQAALEPDSDKLTVELISSYDERALKRSQGWIT
jgi:hypothetical protein